jgi:hypothetical protein
MKHFINLLEQMKQKFEANSRALEIFEDTEYLVMMIIFYTVHKFKFDVSKNDEFSKFIFYLHNAQSKNYFDFVAKNFSQEGLKE